jgi:hypothetical protein
MVYTTASNLIYPDIWGYFQSLQREYGKKKSIQPGLTKALLRTLLFYEKIDSAEIESHLLDDAKIRSILSTFEQKSHRVENELIWRLKIELDKDLCVNGWMNKISFGFSAQFGRGLRFSNLFPNDMTYKPKHESYILTAISYHILEIYGYELIKFG